MPFGFNINSYEKQNIIMWQNVQNYLTSRIYIAIPFESKLFLFADELAIDYQFTFNLSKSDDKHLTGINFKNTPTKMDVDVDFSITCSVPAKVSPKMTSQFCLLPFMGCGLAVKMADNIIRGCVFSAAVNWSVVM